jgi:tRNA pseudouridine38-40 synthase
VPNFRLLVEYDGTHLEGWQIQPEPARTVQGVLVTTLARITGVVATVNGAGRTDAGVHAEGQVANTAIATRLAAAELQRALNALLPPDVAVREVAVVPDAFHARRDAQSKLYVYRLWTGIARSPLRERNSLRIRAPLDLDAMRAAALGLVGTHDFSSFRGAGSAVIGSVRTLSRVEIRGERGGDVALDFEGTGFLRHMVRNLVGTLLEVGRGRRAPESIPALLAARDRDLAGATAPAHGLTLIRVRYDFPPESEGLAAERVDAGEPLG